MLTPYNRVDESVLDARVVLFTLAASLAAGLLASLAPMLQSTRTSVSQSLKEGGREGTFQRSRLRSGLVIAQVALSAVLVVYAGLFARSLRNVHAIQSGYDVDRVMVASYFGEDPALGTRLLPVFSDAAVRLAGVPGVEGAAVSMMGPLMGLAGTRIFLPNHDTLPHGPAFPTANFVGPGFFSVTGMRLLQGRDFNASDVAGAEPVMIVNESMAKATWPGQAPSGNWLILDRATDPCVTVVGVVSDAHLAGIVNEFPSHLYQPAAQVKRLYMLSLTVRAAPEMRAALAQLLRRELRPQLPAAADFHVGAVTETLARQHRNWRMGAALFSVFGALALIVAGVGVYSVIAYAFSQRTHELGVPIALGAHTRRVVRLVLGEGLRIVAVGAALGLVLSLALGRLIASLLYGTSTHDPMVLALVALILLGAGAMAGLLPGWRAARVDPVIALRAE